MTQLVGRYERPLYRFLLRMTGDPALAEDLFQETFLRLHRARSAYHPSQELKPYLFRIALNAFRDARARLKAHATASLDAPGRADDPESGGTAAPLREQLPSPTPPPSADCEQGELRHRVRAALDRLPETEREVVVLRVFEGLSFPEIAQATDVPVPTAKSRLRYALRRLRPILEHYLAGPAPRSV